jgi:hypothetical protein
MEWCNRRRHWRKEEFRKRVWTDESKIEYDPNPAGQKVRYKPGQQLNEKHLKPTFKSGRTSIQIWCAIQYGSKCNLVRICHRTPDERTSPRDRLGMNAKQYSEEVFKAGLIPYWLKLEDPEGSYLVEDGDPAHRSGLAKDYREFYGIKKDDHPAGSPDLNAIENAWKMLKTALRMRWSDKAKRPHSADELWIAAQEEWDSLPQWKLDKLVDSFPQRVEACLAADGGNTKW